MAGKPNCVLRDIATVRLWRMIGVWVILPKTEL